MIYIFFLTGHYIFAFAASVKSNEISHPILDFSFISILGSATVFFFYLSHVMIFSFCHFVFQEDQNRGKPNWEHLNDDLHVLITCEDAENRAQMKIQRAIDEVRKLLTVVSKIQGNLD